MWKYFTHKKTRRYIDVLNSLVKSYNDTFHRSIKTTPASVTKSNETEISKNLYTQLSKSAKPKLKIGDKVRINKTKRTFDKGYLTNWTREIFEITHVNKTFSPITYKIKELQGVNKFGGLIMDMNFNQ